MFAINGRFQTRPVTGVERYASEVTARFRSHPSILKPEQRQNGMRGHLWEQIVLPARASGKVLWSPCNSGPIFGARQVVTIHDTAVLDHPEWFSRQFAALYGMLLPELGRRAAAIIAVSKHTKMRLIEKLRIAEQRISVIPNGVAPRFCPQTHVEVEAVRARLALPAGPYVLSLCSLEPRKNLARLLSAWEKVGEQRPDVTLVLGGGGGKPGIFSSAGRRGAGGDSSAGRPHGSVMYTGYVPDEVLPALYSGAACFVYPSLYEGFGLPVLEALACGTAVITSGSTSLAEVAGGMARLIDPLSPGEIAGALLETLAAPAREDLRAARCAHATSYDWNVCAADTERLLLSLN
jgi:glycosyltransferase involved in cell wall biosynthesis